MKYRNHWWKCNGPCQKRPPFFGIVRRAMNRAPSRHDPWWAEHQKTCGGTYLKIKEPEGYKKKGGKKVKQEKGQLLKGGGKANSGGTVNTDKRIDDMFSKINTKTEIDLTLSDSSEKGPLDADSVIDRRRKMLAAAESRLTMNTVRGKRSLTHSDKEASSKRAKLDSESGHSSSHISSTIIDLCEDVSPEPVQSTSSGVQNDICTTGVVLVDESSVSDDDDVMVMDGEEFRTCPVCGLNTIPAVIINAHVAFCLEEDNWENVND